jgi:hypothetical protein
LGLKKQGILGTSRCSWCGLCRYVDQFIWGNIRQGLNSWWHIGHFL